MHIYRPNCYVKSGHLLTMKVPKVTVTEIFDNISLRVLMIKLIYRAYDTTSPLYMVDNQGRNCLYVAIAHNHRYKINEKIVYIATNLRNYIYKHFQVKNSDKLFI